MLFSVLKVTREDGEVCARRNVVKVTSYFIKARDEARKLGFKGSLAYGLSQRGATVFTDMEKYQRVVDADIRLCCPHLCVGRRQVLASSCCFSASDTLTAKAQNGKHAAAQRI